MGIAKKALVLLLSATVCLQANQKLQEQKQQQKVSLAGLNLPLMGFLTRQKSWLLPPVPLSAWRLRTNIYMPGNSPLERDHCLKTKLEHLLIQLVL